MKQGIRTSEFWITAVTVVLALLGKSGALPIDFPQEAFLTVAVYVISRGFAKYLAAKGAAGQ